MQAVQAQKGGAGAATEEMAKPVGVAAEVVLKAGRTAREVWKVVAGEAVCLVAEVVGVTAERAQKAAAVTMAAIMVAPVTEVAEVNAVD